MRLLWGQLGPRHEEYSCGFLPSLWPPWADRIMGGLRPLQDCLPVIARGHTGRLGLAAVHSPCCWEGWCWRLRSLISQETVNTKHPQLLCTDPEAPCPQLGASDQSAVSQHGGPAPGASSTMNALTGTLCGMHDRCCPEAHPPKFCSHSFS